MYPSTLSLALAALAVTGAAASKPLVTREPTNLLCEHGYLKTVEALRSAIEHFGIGAAVNDEALEEIAWDVEFEDELNAQLRPTRTMFVYDEKFDQLVTYDQRALLFLPLSIGVYVGADGHTHMAFHDGDHFLANFDVYEAEEGLDAVDEVLWTLAKAAHCKFPKGDFEESTEKGSTTRARIGTEARATLEIVKLREQGTPGLVEKCNRCLHAVSNGDSSGDSIVRLGGTEDARDPVEDLFYDIVEERLEEAFHVEQKVLLRTDDYQYTVTGYLNTVDDYFYLRQFGQAASAILPVRIALSAEYIPDTPEASDSNFGDSGDSYDGRFHTYCVSTLGTEYYSEVFGCELLHDTCEVQTQFIHALGRRSTDGDCEPESDGIASEVAVPNQIDNESD